VHSIFQHGKRLIKPSTVARKNSSNLCKFHIRVEVVLNTMEVVLNTVYSGGRLNITFSQTPSIFPSLQSFVLTFLRINLSGLTTFNQPAFASFKYHRHNQGRNQDFDKGGLENGKFLWRHFEEPKWRHIDILEVLIRHN